MPVKIKTESINDFNALIKYCCTSVLYIYTLKTNKILNPEFNVLDFLVSLIDIDDLSISYCRINGLHEPRTNIDSVINTISQSSLLRYLH